MIPFPVKVMGRDIPADAECFCTTRHHPAYPYPLPYDLPDGTTIWLCPNTFYGALSCLELYRRTNGALGLKVRAAYGVTARRLAYIHYRMETEDLACTDVVAAHKMNAYLKSQELRFKKW